MSDGGPLDVEEQRSRAESISSATAPPNDNLSITYQRPDVTGLVGAEISATPVADRILVVGCGPEGLMTPVRNVAAKSIQAGDRSIEVHLEQFRW